MAPPDRNRITEGSRGRGSGKRIPEGTGNHSARGSIVFGERGPPPPPGGCRDENGFSLERIMPKGGEGEPCVGQHRTPAAPPLHSPSRSPPAHPGARNENGNPGPYPHPPCDVLIGNASIGRTTPVSQFVPPHDESATTRFSGNISVRVHITASSSTFLSNSPGRYSRGIMDTGIYRQMEMECASGEKQSARRPAPPFLLSRDSTEYLFPAWDIEQIVGRYWEPVDSKRLATGTRDGTRGGHSTSVQLYESTPAYHIE